MSLFRRIIPILAAAFMVCSAAYAQDTRKQEASKARLEKEIARLESLLADNGRRSSDALSRLPLVRQKIAGRKALIEESDKEIASINSEITAKQQEIDRLQARLDTMSLYYSKLVRSAYKNRDSRIWYMYILSSENLGQAFRRFGYLRGLSAQMNVQAKKINETREELEAQALALEGLKKKAQAAKAARVAELDKLKGEEKSASNLVAQLQKDKKKYQGQLASKKKQVEALNREIERIIKAAMASAGKPSQKGSSASKPKAEVDYKLSGSFSANKGKLPWPAEGPVIDHFGQHSHPVYKNVRLPFNNGVTIALSPGTEIHAVFDGTVKQIVVMPGYNQCVLVQHGTYFTFYCKLTGVHVKAGEKIKAGQVLGKVDTIDGDTQLHFQIWSGSTPQNPETWLR